MEVILFKLDCPQFGSCPCDFKRKDLAQECACVSVGGKEGGKEAWKASANNGFPTYST